MAEAENWSRLSKEKLRREAAAKINADDDASVGDMPTSNSRARTGRRAGIVG
jgi:hypothetical protein